MKIIKSILVLVLTLQFGGVIGQSFDQTRMDRDLKIAEDVVKSLFKSEGKDGHFYSVNPRASYIEGYGVLINLTGSGYFYSSSFGDGYNYSYRFGDDESTVVIDSDYIEEMKVQAELAAREAEVVATESKLLAEEQQRLERELAREKRELERRMRELERKESLSRGEKEELQELEDESERVENERESIIDEQAERLRKRELREMKERIGRVAVVPPVPPVSPDIDVHVGDDGNFLYVGGSGKNVDPKVWKETFQNVANTFFTDYADLIGQLKNDEKIMMVSKGRDAHYGSVRWASSKNQPKLSAEASRANIASYKSGKLSKDKFLASVKFSESEAGEMKKADLELLSTIFQRMYKADLATTYYASGSIRYEYLENVGAIFKMKVYSSISSGRDSYRIVTQNKTGLTREERDQTVNGMYPQFEKELKENIMDYGKTVRSLKGNESLRFEVKLTECKGCEMPEKLEVSVKQSVLADYNSGKISRENAISKMIVKKD